MDQVNDQLEQLKNTFVIVEGTQKCAVCGEPFTNDSSIAITQDREKVHEKCLSEEERELAVELKDMF